MPNWTIQLISFHHQHHSYAHRIDTFGTFFSFAMLQSRTILHWIDSHDGSLIQTAPTPPSHKAIIIIIAEIINDSLRLCFILHFISFIFIITSDVDCAFRCNSLIINSFMSLFGCACALPDQTSAIVRQSNEICNEQQQQQLKYTIHSTYYQPAGIKYDTKYSILSTDVDCRIVK